MYSYRSPFAQRYLRLESDPGSGGGGDPPPGDPPADPAPPAAGDWYEGLGDDLKGDASIAAFKGKTVADVATAVRDLTKQVAEATPPAKPEEYQLQIPEKILALAKDPAEKTEAEVVFKKFLEEAHADGLTRAKAEARLNRIVSANLAAHEAAKKEIATAEGALKAKWGDQYAENLRISLQVYEGLPEHLKGVIETAGLKTHPHVVELLHLVAEARSEGRLHKGGPAAGSTSPEAALYPSMATG